MTIEEELGLAARLRELRRDLLALALLDPRCGLELERLATGVADGRSRVGAIVDEPDGTPDSAQRHLHDLVAAVARLHTEQARLHGELGDRERRPGGPVTAPGQDSEDLERALLASRELAASVELSWDAVGRLLQHTWVDARSPRGSASRRAPPSGAGTIATLGALPPAWAEQARRSRAEVGAIFERFVSSHQGLVAKVARHYRGLGLSLEDLMQDGNIGLLRALEKFDERRGRPFGAYAVWWVRESVRRALAQQARTIRLPAHAIAKRYALGKASRQLAHELGRDPSSEELSRAMGWELESIDDVMRLSREPLSLDAPRADGTEITLGDALADGVDESPNDRVAIRESAGHLQDLLASLSPRERHVLRLRYGLDGGDEQTLEEIGRSLELTRERIRQIVAGALDKLNRATRARHLEL